MSQIFGCLACKGTYVDTQRDGGVYMHACPPLPPDKFGVQAERSNKRDETPAMDRRGRLTGIRLEGAGVTCLTDAKKAEPAWITAMKKLIAKEEEE
jgi:hypothetical protein